MMTEQSDKKWLIKSENKILGPYNFEQVENLLFKKQISLIDEIRDPETRWLYIRENIHFKKVIEDVRSQIDSKNDITTTQQSGITGLSGTKTLDESLHTTRSPLTPYTDVSMETQDAALVSESVDLTPSGQAPKTVITAEKINYQRNFVYQDDFKTKKSLQLFSKNFLIGLAFVFITAVGSFVSYYFYNKYTQQKFETDMLVQVKKYQFLGLDQQAATFYAKLPNFIQRKHLIEVIELFPYFETLGIIKNSDLDTLENSGKLSSENKAAVYMARFWFLMQMQNLEAAQIQIIKAKALLPADNLVNENEAILNLRNGLYSKALEAFLKLYGDGNSGRYLVGALQSLQGVNAAEKTKFMGTVEKLVDRHIAIRYDYKKELLLAQMAFAKLNKNEILFKLSWKQFVNTPTQMSQLFRKPSLLAPLSYQWKDLEPYKVIIRESLDPTEVTIFKMHNYLESNQIGAAVDYAEKNKNSIVDVAMRQQIFLLVYYAMNKKSEILAIDQTGQLDKNSELNNILLALTKVSLDPTTNIQTHMDFYKQNNLKFYLQWTELSLLMAKKSSADIRAYIKENFSNDSDFVIANDARGIIE